MATTKCGCGIPNRANYHLSIIVGTEDQTDSVDAYLCEYHTPNVPEGHHNAQRDPFRFDQYAAKVHRVLAFDGAESWEVLGYRMTELR